MKINLMTILAKSYGGYRQRFKDNITILYNGDGVLTLFVSFLMVYGIMQNSSVAKRGRRDSGKY